MEHRRKIYILLCGVIVALLFVACGKSSDTQGDSEPTWYEQIYFNITRTDGEDVAEGTTYNFTLFGGTDGNTSYSGTYRVPVETDGENTSILYPCKVSATTGVIDDAAFDSSCGLSAPAGSYQIVVASPAVAVSSVTDHTGSERKGFKIDRHIDDSSSSEVDLFIKGPRTVSVSGVEIGGEKEYISSSADLCRPRSKFVLYICCEDEDKEDKKYYVYDVYFDNILSTGYYNPTVGYYRASDALVNDFRPYTNTVLTATSTSQIMEVNDSDKTSIVDSEENIDIDDAFYLIANDCSGGESTYVAVPHLVIKLNRNEGKDIENDASVVTIPLEYDFQRSYYYEFTITISPVSITLSGIAVADWSDGGGDDIAVQNLSSIVFDWDDVGNWEEGNGGTAEFN